MVLINKKLIPSIELNIFASDNLGQFALLQSRTHEIWARFFGSSLEDRLRYTPSDCFETFPFPENFEASEALKEIGERYYEFRAKLMIDADEGLTKTYNRFNDPDETRSNILELRRLHDEMDRAVLAAYGWSDLELEPVFEREWEGDEDENPGPWRLRWSEAMRDEVLARLLDLNARRAAEEQLEALAEMGTAKPKGKRGHRRKATEGTISMFAEEDRE